jgi:hypothetical protein
MIMLAIISSLVCHVLVGLGGLPAERYQSLQYGLLSLHVQSRKVLLDCMLASLVRQSI